MGLSRKDYKKWKRKNEILTFLNENYGITEEMLIKLPSFLNRPVRKEIEETKEEKIVDKNEKEKFEKNFYDFFNKNLEEFNPNGEFRA